MKAERKLAVVAATVLAAVVVGTLMFIHANTGQLGTHLGLGQARTSCTPAPTTSQSRGGVGAVSQFPLRSGGYEGAITSGRDGNLWLLQSDVNDGPDSFVVRVTTAGIATEYRVPSPYAGLGGIASGPDGNIWLTEQFGPRAVASAGRLGAASKVAVITPSGFFTEFPAPVADSSLEAITVGPDCNLWVTDSWANGVDKVTTSGTFTQYQLPNPNSFPSGIVSGSDGNLWVLETTGHKLARITTSGIVREFALPDPQDFEFAIAAGSDGNLWMTGQSRLGEGGVVLRATTSGTFTEYPVPPSPYGGSPGSITDGPDGNLWFTAGRSIDRVTTSGAFSEYAVPSSPGNPPLGLGGVAGGPDGNIWFTEQTTTPIALVGRLALA